jgi:RNA polymerase sigma factor (sigma-70 family)
MSLRTDQELVSAAQSGDKSAFGLLVERHRPMVQAIIRGMIPDALFHHDLAQEALLQAYLSLDMLRENQKFRSWLYGIARNVCLMFLRVQRIRSISLDFLQDAGGEVPSPHPSPEEVAERLELRRIFFEAIEQLSPANREAIVLFYYEAFDLQETAALLGVSANTVKGRLHRGRKHLQQLLISSEAVEIEGVEVMIPVTVVDVVVLDHKMDDDTPRKMYVLVLLDEAYRRAVCIWIGEFEAVAIALKLNNTATPRPMTQTFIARLIDACGATLERIEISELKDDIFYATVHLGLNGEARQVDARPSDAIGLAVNTDTPLFVSEQVMSQVGFKIPENYVPTGKGLAEIQAMTKIPDAQHWQRMKTDAEYQKFRDPQQRSELVISMAFEEVNG